MNHNLPITDLSSLHKKELVISWIFPMGIIPCLKSNQHYGLWTNAGLFKGVLGTQFGSLESRPCRFSLKKWLMCIEKSKQKNKLPHLV